MLYKNLESFYYKDRQEYEDLYLTRFNSLFTQKIDFYINERQAFYLNTDEIVQLIYDIMQANRKLDEICATLPGIALTQYRKNKLIDEINITNEIEGVYSTKREISDILDNMGNKDKALRLENMVKKYERIMQNDEIDLSSCESIRKLYDEIVLQEVVAACPENFPDGKYFRKNTVSVWSNKQEMIHRGIMPENAIDEAMEKALNILNGDKGNKLINIAIFHYLLGYIHPFYDGNGRMNRFISSYMLSKELNYLISYGLSVVIKENRNRYNKLFKITNDKLNRGDLTPFVTSFLEFIKTSLLHMNTKLREKEEKLDYYEAILENKYRGKPKYWTLLYILLQNELFGFEGLKMVDLEALTSIGYTAIKNVLELNQDIIKTNQIGKRIFYTMDLEALDKH
ncbi:MAG: Fic family protein [Clostridia bacterium]|nr:Fic family protein [Clostridia bacterium]